ncbi:MULTISPECIES: M28 family peptidase [Kordiimonas]|jgi:hypothetical protein|uniref:M28 family peptidase n=1 Tax=Kordiimonas TaxID=288021 RepID=UPI002580EF3A|nr:M28 family peptidase [Kordiimonas sp. UBA4487]
MIMPTIFRTLSSVAFIGAFSWVSNADTLTDLMPEPALTAIAEETSGVLAKRNLDRITLYHRMRASDQFDEAAAFVLSELKSYGFDTAEIMAFPADGETMFGTQKSRLAWQVDFAELWEVEGKDAGGKRIRRLADWKARPLTLAQDSDSADVSAELVYVGKGTNATDYDGKTIAGKIVLTSSQPAAVEALALRRYGAVGILSYAANQKSAWWQLDDSLVRWGHLSSFRQEPAFAFMTSLGEARALQARLTAGETIRLHAKVVARREPGEYRIVTATIPGSDPKLAQEEIAFSCHLDHPRPGANDNASGCVAILEAARVIRGLVNDGALPAPKRTIRFFWPSEIEATLIMLNARPKLAARLKHVIHMDMVGGGPATKAVFRVSRGPKSSADISGEIAFALADFVNSHTQAYADGKATAFTLASPEGGREPLMALKEWLSVGSDHDVFASGSWNIPVTYLHDWPDRYIHTTKDVAANIDPTKLKRAAFIGAAQAAILAGLTDGDGDTLVSLMGPNIVMRTGELMAQTSELGTDDRKAALRGHWSIEKRIRHSITSYVPNVDIGALHALQSALEQLIGNGGQSTAGTVYIHNPNLKGTMHGFGYSYLEDKLGTAATAALALPRLELGYEKAYEALNFVDGKRTVNDIYDLLVAEFGPVPFTALSDYLLALSSINVISAR